MYSSHCSRDVEEVQLTLDSRIYRGDADGSTADARRCTLVRTIVQETGEDTRGRCVIAGAGVLV